MPYSVHCSGHALCSQSHILILGLQGDIAFFEWPIEEFYNDD